MTEAFARGAAATLTIAEALGARRALLKAKSPSCGLGSIYDGRFCGRLIEGNGVAADLLLAHGIAVCTEEALSGAGILPETAGAQAGADLCENQNETNPSE